MAAGVTTGGLVIGSGAYIQSAGTMSNVTVQSGGIAFNDGVGSATSVSAGGEELVAVSGVEIGATLAGVPGGGLPTSSGTALKVGLQIVSGMTQNVVVSDGGYQRLAYLQGTISGGEAMHTTVLSGGVVEVDSRSILDGAVVSSGGELLIYDDYGSVGTMALNGGALIDLGDQIATAASISGGELVVSSGGTVTESFSLSGSTSGLSVSVGADGHGGTLLTIVSSTATASHRAASRDAAVAVQAAAAFAEPSNAAAVLAAFALQSAHAPFDAVAGGAWTRHSRACR